MPKILTYQKGSIVYFEGDKDDRIFILQSGQIILTSTNLETGLNDVEQIHIGEFFGLKSALSHMPRMETANVLSEAKVVVLSVAEFENTFSKNQNIMLKMLRVFSARLRDLHKKTEEILNDNTQVQKPEEAMLNVAKNFFNDGQFHSASEECQHILNLYPGADNIKQIESLKKNAEEQAKTEEPFMIDSSLAEKKNANKTSLSAFSSPVFQRFTRNYESGDVIISEYEPGNSFFVIEEGEVQLLKNINGGHKTLDILHAGEFFGEMAILDNSPRSATCIARGKVKCLIFDKDNFGSLVTGNPQMVMVLLKLFCKRIYDQRRMFKILCIKDIPARIADVFCMYDEQDKSDEKLDPDNNKRTFSLTYGDIAHWAGISLEDCQNELNSYVERHKIEIFDNRIVVRNINDMKRIVDNYYMAHNS